MGALVAIGYAILGVPGLIAGGIAGIYKLWKWINLLAHQLVVLWSFYLIFVYPLKILYSSNNKLLYTHLQHTPLSELLVLLWPLTKWRILLFLPFYSYYSCF